ncbi:MAG TPA: UpxY family transcription antiterminator [Ferruginibacter sp.]|nr:UpxY family transcription antiterminator [Ferruginibacter sp.]
MNVTKDQRSFAMSEAFNWYVVYTRPNWEKKVSSLLKQRDIESYCPLQKITRNWSDRKKILETPLFKGYVFVHVHEGQKWTVTEVPGVLNYVHWLGRPAKIRTEEIENIKKFLREFEDVTVNVIPEVEENVEVTRGILMNYKGIVLEVCGKRVKVKIQSLGIEMTAVFEASDLRVLKKMPNLPNS